MAASSNTRYQLVNSFEALALPAIPGGTAVQTLTSFVVRTLNNVRARHPPPAHTHTLSGKKMGHALRILSS